MISDKTYIGDATSCQVITQLPHPEKLGIERLVADIHVHPGFLNSHGLSNADYSSFISESREIAKIITWSGGTMMALKTTATPNNLDPETVTKQVAVINHDFYVAPFKDPFQKIIDFNKAICTEFGMTLYLAPINNRALATRVDVTR